MKERPKGLAAVLRRALQRHRGERHVLPVADAGHLSSLARPDAARLSLRHQGQPLRDTQQETRRRPARRPARARPRRRSGQPSSPPWSGSCRKFQKNMERLEGLCPRAGSAGAGRVMPSSSATRPGSTPRSPTVCARTASPCANRMPPTGRCGRAGNDRSRVRAPARPRHDLHRSAYDKRPLRAWDRRRFADWLDEGRSMDYPFRLHRSPTRRSMLCD